MPIFASVGSLLVAVGLLDWFAVGWRVLAVTIGAALLFVMWARVETVVEGRVLTTTLAPLWRREINLDDVAAVDVVGVVEPFDLLVDDHAVAFSERYGRPFKRSGSAVRVELRDGRVHQIYSRHPRALCDAIDAGSTRGP